MTSHRPQPIEKTCYDATGLLITYYVWEAARPRGIVQICHGFGEYARRYDELAYRLNDAGYTVYADDHRGHGKTGLDHSGGDHSRLGRLGPRGVQLTVDAVAQFSTIIRSDHPDLPLALVAHSWGSIIGQMILNQRKAGYDSVVLTGTVYRMPGSMGAGDLNKKHQTPGGTGFEWLSRDPEVSRAADLDPLMPRVSAVGAFGIRGVLSEFGRPARSLPDVPLMIMVGSDDTFGGAVSAQKLAGAYRLRSGLSNVQLKIYAGARHEIFNEINRPEVYDDLILWLDRSVGQ